MLFHNASSQVEGKASSSLHMLVLDIVSRCRRRRRF